MTRKTLGAARSLNTFGIFKDHETDWLFKRTLEYASEKAAEIGECLHTASKINEKDAKIGLENCLNWGWPKPVTSGMTCKRSPVQHLPW